MPGAFSSALFGRADAHSPDAHRSIRQPHSPFPVGLVVAIPAQSPIHIDQAQMLQGHVGASQSRVELPGHGSIDLMGLNLVARSGRSRLLGLPIE
jgi:hypothetical protein